MHITTLVGQIFKNSDSQFQEYFRTSDPEKLDIMHMKNVMIFFFHGNVLQLSIYSIIFYY